MQSGIANQEHYILRFSLKVISPRQANRQVMSSQKPGTISLTQNLFSYVYLASPLVGALDLQSGSGHFAGSQLTPLAT